MSNLFGLLGNGGQADEADSYCAPQHAAFRAVSAENFNSFSPLVDIRTNDPYYTSLPVTVAVGAPGLKHSLVSTWRGSLYQTIVASSADLSSNVEIGDGCIISPQTAITFRVHLAQHVILNVGASISHGTVVGEFTTISPGARIAGDCVVGAGVFLGIGAVISHGLRIADGTIIGAGAVVVDDIDTSGVWVGVPARKIKDHDGWLMHL